MVVDKRRVKKKERGEENAPTLDYLGGLDTSHASGELAIRRVRTECE